MAWTSYVQYRIRAVGSVSASADPNHDRSSVMVSFG